MAQFPKEWKRVHSLWTSVFSRWKSFRPLSFCIIFHLLHTNHQQWCIFLCFQIGLWFFVLSFFVFRSFFVSKLGAKRLNLRLLHSIRRQCWGNCGWWRQNVVTFEWFWWFRMRSMEVHSVGLAWALVHRTWFYLFHRQDVQDQS